MVFAQWSEDTGRNEDCTEENNSMLKAGSVLNKLLTSKAAPPKLRRLPSRLHLGLAALAFETICLCWGEGGTQPAVTKKTSLSHFYFIKLRPLKIWFDPITL